MLANWHKDDKIRSCCIHLLTCSSNSSNYSWKFKKEIKDVFYVITDLEK